MHTTSGAQNVFTGKNGPDYCHTSVIRKDGTTATFRIYAPSVALNENLPQDFPKQLNVASLWPLQVGKKVEGRFSGINQVGVNGTWNVAIIVEKYETVTVPAGTFEAFLVMHTQEASKYKGVWKYWWAPNPGVTVKWEYSDSEGRKDGLEVVKFTR
jgi:hypothetical protein